MPVIPVLTMLPLSVTIIGAAFAIVILNHYFATRRRPHEIMWAVAFVLLAIGAVCQVYADVSGSWSILTARLYYLTGAILNVGFLGLGTLYLMFSRKVATVGLVLMLLLSVASIYVLFTGPVNSALLTHDDGYRAVAFTGSRILAAVTNSLGTLLVVGGALWSAYVFWRKRILKDRMIGVLLLAAGTFIVALGGTITGATGLTNHDYLYLSMAVGVVVMFAGYLQTIRPTVPVPSTSAVATRVPPIS
ncbi:MAG: hypothetical protein M3014_05205 [Chloroflexota bacterium]|nr:hypothetical protein [Chloroflexota bacterium]